ncbi:DNA polymerase [Leuconostoc phage Ln-9]|uniref:DNA polymerase n=1 Tax=Leuconostoc phage Ln-9 TaxID=1536605 RepID=A0A0D3MKT1_9CAUD|nr:DNA polymerase [Leuconostoc phage Ln-9]AIM50856.1 DNA polymerase [Leuconostoc phage Ln-9]
MKKTFTKVVKAISKTRPILGHVHYTNDRIELTDSHVAIIEELKTPLESSFDILINLDGVPSVANYPDLKRLVPTDNTNWFIIDIPMLEAVAKINKKEQFIKLESDGTIGGQRVGEFERLEGFEYITFSPKYVLWLLEYAKESGQKEHITIELSDNAFSPAVVYFEQSETLNTFIITPIRIRQNQS